MGKLVVGIFLTLDGVYQGPGGRDEDPEGGFKYGGWTWPYWDDEIGRRVLEATTASDALLLGRKTHDIFAASWPNADPADPVAGHLNSVPKYVASRTIEASDWNNTTILAGDVVAEVTGLKGNYDQIGITGSGGLIQTLLQHDLIDVFELWTFPVALGSGKRLFGDGTMAGALKLTDSWASDTGVTFNTYERAGALQIDDSD